MVRLAGKVAVITGDSSFVAGVELSVDGGMTQVLTTARASHLEYPCNETAFVRNIEQPR